MPKSGQKWAFGALESAFFDRHRPTLGRHQTLAISPFFAVRSLLLQCTARETDGGITDRVIDAFAPFEELALRHIEDDRSSCSIGVLAAFDGLCDDGAPSILCFNKCNESPGRYVQHLEVALILPFGGKPRTTKEAAKVLSSKIVNFAY